MRIAIFTDSYFPRINGVTVSINNFASEFVKSGREVCIACLDYPFDPSSKYSLDQKQFDQNSKFKIVRINSHHIVYSKEDRIAKISAWHKFKKAIDEFKPDILHINTEFTMGYFAAIYSRRRGIPFVYTMHTMWEDYFPNYALFLPDTTLKAAARKMMMFYLKRAKVIVAPSKQISDLISSYGIEKEVNIIPTGISSYKYSKTAAFAKSFSLQKASKFPKNRKLLCFAGRLVKEKNIEFLFEVLKNVRKVDSSVYLLLVGDGPHMEELKQKVKELNLSKYVYFTGYMQPSDMQYYYRMSKIFVFPSKTETQGLVTIEAIMQGIPVVAIGEMGTVDVMKGDNGGFMVPDNVEIFTEKVLALLQDEQLYNQKVEEALKWSDSWKISNLAPKLLECYKKSRE